VCLVLFDIVGATVAWFLLRPADYAGHAGPERTAPLSAPPLANGNH
jgi:ACS family hexuronate transporter-like MFS transporter